MTKDITMQIPIYNSPHSVLPLLDSLLACGLSEYLSKILFVNDASTDNTLEVIKEQQNSHELGSLIAIADLPKNMGRYYVNVEGVKSVKTKYLILTNCRAQFQRGFDEVIAEIEKQTGLYSGCLSIDTEHSVYNLHWERLHRLIYSHIFEAYANGPFQITTENMSQYLIGATVYLCETDSYRATTQLMPKGEILGDDTTFLKNMMEICPVFLDDRLAIKWEPRQHLWPYIYHFYERSPNFVEYHVFTKRTFLFKPFVVGLIVSMLTMLTLLLAPALGFGLVAAELTLIALSATVFVRSPREFFRVFALHTLCILAFGIGVLQAFFSQGARQIIQSFQPQAKENEHV
jgi:glycosyltransferase involved in cell wall biosynthesis